MYSHDRIKLVAIRYILREQSKAPTIASANVELVSLALDGAQCYLFIVSRIKLEIIIASGFMYMSWAY